VGPVAGVLGKLGLVSGFFARESITFSAVASEPLFLASGGNGKFPMGNLKPESEETGA